MLLHIYILMELWLFYRITKKELGSVYFYENEVIPAKAGIQKKYVN